jgi:DNA-binding NtrC family response regulator
METPCDEVMGVTILIIERETMLQEHLMRHLETQNWQIFESSQQKDIKRILKKHHVDVVLMNLNDLINEGMDLIKMIKINRSAVQVITINNGDQISMSIEGMKLGVFDDFLMPLDLDSLISRIREAHQAKKATEALLSKEPNCKEPKNVAKESKYKKQKK